MADDNSDEYRKAERIMKLADRAFPNLDPLARAAKLSEPSTTAARVPARAAETARLAELVTFDGDEPEPAPSAPVAAPDNDDVFASLATMAAELPTVAAPLVVAGVPKQPSAPAPTHDYFAGLDVQLTEADRQSRQSRNVSWGIMGGALVLGALGEGAVAARIEREQAAVAEHNAMLTAIENEAHAQRSQAAQLARQMGAVKARVETTRDDLLRTTQITAELAIANAQRDAEPEESDAESEPQGPSRAERADRRLQRQIRRGEVIAVEGDAAPKRNEVAAAIDRVLAGGGK